MHPGVVGILILSLSFAPGGPHLRAAVSAVRGQNGLIAFTLRDQTGRLQICTQKQDGSSRRQLTLEGDNGRPDWSPDGSQIAFASLRKGKRWVAVMNADGSNQRLVAEDGFDPAWSPDGKTIAFARSGDQAEGHLQSQIWLMNADGSHRKQITRSHTLKTSPSWSPDGKHLLFLEGKNKRNALWIVDADGSHPRRLSELDAGPFPGRASWQPLPEKREERNTMTASVRSYRTHFQLNEDPISEQGKWITGAKAGKDWYDILTKNGVAFGAVTQGAYTDPTALLTGVWGKNQTAKAKVFSRNQTEKYYQEVEIRLRSALAPHLCTGYEVFFRCLKTPNAYAEIVRWNGKVGDWTSLQKHTGAQYGVQDGDMIAATIIGNVIKGYINGVEVISAVDDTYAEGSPGMGFNYGVEQSNGDFGFSSYEVDTYNEVESGPKGR